MIHVNPSALQSRGLSPADIVRALGASNVIVPAGAARIAAHEYNLAIDSNPTSVTAACHPGGCPGAV